MSTNRNWCFTINNPTELDKTTLNGLKHVQNVKRFIVQLERGTNNTPHFQGYIEFNHSVRLTGIKTLISSNGHYEPRRASAYDAWQYCTKSTGLKETDTILSIIYGTPPTAIGRGRRSDIHAATIFIRDGGALSDMVEEHAVVIVKYHKGLKVLIDLVTPDRDRTVNKIVEVYWGDPGSGKTRKAYDENESMYAVPIQQGTSIWMDGYANEECVLMDDFEGQMPLRALLRILDRYPIRVPTKGGHCKFNPNTIIITSNSHPRDWYKWENHPPSKKAALMRRITTIQHFSVIQDGFEDD